jgi:tetratricopeptide (TPR) repeat protein
MKFIDSMLSPLPGIVLIVGLLIGCKGGLSTPSDSLQKALASKIPNKDLFVAKDYGKRQPLSVAILPFDNQTKEPEAAQLLRHLFYNNFSSLAYKDIEISTIDKKLDHFEPAGVFDSADITNIGQNLKADAVIIGRVTKFETLYAGLYSSFSVAFEMKMIATDNNELLWSVKHSETKRNSKIPLTPIGAIISAASTAIDLSRYNMINTSNKLCQVSIDTIPASTTLKGQSYPRILTLVHDGVNRVLKKGAKLQVGVEGTPGLKAQFVITPRDAPIDMQEKEAGSYVGTYIVRDGDKLSDGQIVVTLTDQWNNDCRWEDTLGFVNLDGTAPDPPTGIKASAGDAQVAIRWNQSTANDIAGYQVLRSQTPLSGYAKVTLTEFTHFKDTHLKNDTTYFYRVLAKDKAGNLSQTQAGIPATPVEPGPTLVSGELGPDTVWHPGGNPYFIDQEVILPAGNRLRIEPGVLIKAADTTRFLVQGLLIVAGEANSPVIFTSDHEDGTWEGIFFDHSDAKSSLSHFEISHAITGIHIIDSSPAITSGTIQDCDNGLIITGEKAAPKMKHTTVYQNKKNGLIIKDLSQPYLTTSKIVYNGSAGLKLFHSKGKILGNEISYNHTGVMIDQAPAVIAGNLLQDNTYLDLQSKNTAGSALKIDLNYFGKPENITLLSSQPDQDKTSLTVLESTDLHGPHKEVAFKPFPADKQPDSDQAVWIKARGAKEITSKPSPEKDSGKASLKIKGHQRTALKTKSLQKPPSQETKPSKVALDAFINGIAMARKEAYPEAITFLKKALKDTIKEAEVRFWLGFCYMQSGQIKKALFNYNKAVELDPENLEYLLHLGSALQLSDHWDKAKIVYLEVLRRDPENQDAKLFLKLLKENQK